MINKAQQRRLAKKRVQCINEVLCTPQADSVLADSSVLRNPLLCQSPNLCGYYEIKNSEKRTILFPL